MSVSLDDGLAVSGLWLDPRVLSPAAFAPGDGLQIQSLDGADAPVSNLRISGIYPQRGPGPSLPAIVCTAGLPLDLADPAPVLLGFSQYSLVSICLVGYIVSLISQGYQM